MLTSYLAGASGRHGKAAGAEPPKVFTYNGAVSGATPQDVIY